jgi:hypothetical protein
LNFSFPSFLSVRMKEAWNSQKDGSNTCTGSIIWGGTLLRGSPTRELVPTTAYRLGVDIGERSGGEILLGGKIFWYGV